ncbi:hypothetical protein B7P43_G06199 [Cryptotermes secundus]|uniref:Reverse transcriptase domain-containing protein n=1 Tax=Cryptotermes secundus TaxID=105785 RepID=A0A2J7RAP6_9NEOP|nr:hypothetical protein B7P43_G06199 [Cryptotermes secundus]
MDSIKKDIQTLTDANKVVHLETSTEKTKYMLLSRHQNAKQYHDIKICNRLFEKVAQFRYMGTTITNQNPIQGEIRRRLNSGNAYYHSVQNPSFSRLLSKNIKIRIHKTITLAVVLYRSETWSLTIREEHRQSVKFEVFMEVTMKNAVFWDVALCRYCVN